jgi:hypothetical protein
MGKATDRKNFGINQEECHFMTLKGARIISRFSSKDPKI